MVLGRVGHNRAIVPASSTASLHSTSTAQLARGTRARVRCTLHSARSSAEALTHKRPLINISPRWRPHAPARSLQRSSQLEDGRELDAQPRAHRPDCRSVGSLRPEARAADRRARRAWLKSEHDFGTNYAGGSPSSNGKGREQLDPDAYLKAAGDTSGDVRGSGRRWVPSTSASWHSAWASRDVKACPARRSCRSPAPFSQRSNQRPTPVSTWASRWGISRPAGGSSYRRLREEPHHAPDSARVEAELDSDITRWLKAA